MADRLAYIYIQDNGVDDVIGVWNADTGAFLAEIFRQDAFVYGNIRMPLAAHERNCFFITIGSIASPIYTLNSYNESGGVRFTCSLPFAVDDINGYKPTGLFILSDNHIYILTVKAPTGRVYIWEIDSSGTQLNRWEVGTDSSPGSVSDSLVLIDDIFYWNGAVASSVHRYNKNTSTALADLALTPALHGIDQKPAYLHKNGAKISCGQVGFTGELHYYGGCFDIAGNNQNFKSVYPAITTFGGSCQQFGFRVYTFNAQVDPIPKTILVTTPCAIPELLLQIIPTSHYTNGVTQDGFVICGIPSTGVCPIPWEGGGVFKLVPGKTNDTIYTAPTTTEDVAIPNPFADTYLIGDE